MSVLTEFIQYNNYDLPPTVLIDESKTGEVLVQTYQFYSQQWPINHEPTIPTTDWVHKLKIYIPNNLKHDKALLFVGGGYNADKEGKELWKSPYELLYFGHIAANNNAIVACLQDVPNQYLIMDGKPKKEDQILAYSYKLFMENKNPYILGHLPMAKSIIKAMDFIQTASKDYEVKVDSFVLTGFSKRAWAAWLAAIEDDRVDAIIPGVLDVLNVQKSMIHICSVYSDGCPSVLKDYKNEGVLSSITTPGFAEVMKIEDPFSYVNEPQYKERFVKLDKYIINTSGDNFFTPDSSQFYFKDLPGDNNYIRYLPNAMHYLAGNPISDSFDNIKKVSDAINNYFYFNLNDIELPKIKYEFQGNQIIVESSQVPKSAILWSHNNEEERDFRLISSYSSSYPKIYGAYKLLQSYVRNIMQHIWKFDLCDRCYESQLVKIDCKIDEMCLIQASLPEFKEGWQASFMELHYDIEGRDFIITTEVDIREAPKLVEVNNEL